MFPKVTEENYFEHKAPEFLQKELAIWREDTDYDVEIKGEAPHFTTSLFEKHAPGVFGASTQCGLMEHCSIMSPSQVNTTYDCEIQQTTWIALHWLARCKADMVSGHEANQDVKIDNLYKLDDVVHRFTEYADLQDEKKEKERQRQLKEAIFRQSRLASARFHLFRCYRSNSKHIIQSGKTRNFRGKLVGKDKLDWSETR